MIDFDKPRSAASRAISENIHRRSEATEFTFAEIALDDSDGDSRSLAGRRINDVTAALITLFVALSAVPAASVSPVFQMVWTVLFALTLGGHAAALLLVDPGRPLSAKGLWPVLLAGLALPLAGLVQAGIAGIGLTTSFAGQSVPLGTLAPQASLFAAIRLMGYGALFLVSYEVATRAGRVTAMAWGLFIAVVLQAIWALIALKFLGDVVFWGEKQSYLGAATGTFVNRNSLATYLGMGLNLGVALTVGLAHRPHVRHPKGRSLLSERNLEILALIFLILIIAAALVATQSRMGATASFLSAVLTYVLMSAKHEKAWLGAISRGAALLLVGIVTVSGVFGRALIERGLFTVGDSGSRTDLYHEVLGLMIRARPLTGTGLDTFEPAFELVHVPPVRSGLVWHLAHSSYLMLWSEMGLIVGSLPMLAILLAAYGLIRTIARRRTNYMPAIAALGVIVQVTLHSTVDFSLEIPADTMMFLVIVAIGLGPLRRKERAT